MSLRGGDETLLVVEDDGVIAGLLQRILVRQGYRVTLAERAEEALRFAREHRGELHLMICDLDFPDQGALRVELRRLHPEAIELLISGDPAALARTSAPAALLPLPFTRTELVTRVRGVLDRRATPE